MYQKIENMDMKRTLKITNAGVQYNLMVKLLVQIEPQYLRIPEGFE